MGYCNPEVDALIELQSREADQERRKRLVWDIERKLAEDGGKGDGQAGQDQDLVDFPVPQLVEQLRRSYEECGVDHHEEEEAERIAPDCMIQSNIEIV